MATLYEEEAAPLISRPGIPSAVRDNRRPREKQLAVYIILASIFFERIAFYTLAANLALTLEPVDVGTSYISTIIFAIISDWKLGRAKTIIVGFCLYLMGYISAILMTTKHVSECALYISRATCIEHPIQDCSKCRVWILVTFIVIAIGAGAVESNMAVLGAEQIQDSKITSRYFDKYMVAVNTGGIIATLAFRFSFKFVYAEHRYLVSCIVATATLFISALLFIGGLRYYIHVQSNESVITKCISVVINAFQSWHKYGQNTRSKNNENTTFDSSTLLNASQSLTEGEQSLRIEHRPSTFLDFAKVPNGKFHDRIVDDVKSLRGALVVFTLLIPYWLIYNQLSSTFPIQAKYMSGSDDWKVTFMWLGDPITIIIGIFIFNTIVYKFMDARHRSLTIATKFIIGMCFAVVTMCITGTVEKFRLDGCNNNYSNQSSLPIYYQLPQNIFMGVSEIFAMVASFEYAYFAAPRSAQTLFMSLRFCSLGISSFIATGYFAIFSNTKSKMNFSCPSAQDTPWSFYTYFYILGGLQVIFIIIFITCQKKFRLIKLNPQQMETNQFLQHSSASMSGRQ